MKEKEFNEIKNIINNNSDNIIINDKDKVNNINDRQLYYDSLMDLFSKKQFKKILKLFPLQYGEKKKDEKKENHEIEENNLKESQKHWIFSYIETISIQKIIQNKNQKYYKSQQIPNLKEYKKKENKAINKWISFINQLNKKEKKSNVKSYLEFIILFILQKCLNLSNNCIYQENYIEAVCFLSLGINLINHSYDIFRSPETFILCGEILLTLSFILLAENKYESVENIISISCKFFFISLESILNSSSNCISYSFFNILEQEENIYNIISKILFNLSLSFYHLGISYENQGFPYYSLYAYKQSKYFSSKIKNKNQYIMQFYKFIKGIEKRQLMRNRIIIFFEKFIKSENLIEKELTKEKVEKKYDSLREKKKKRFNRLEAYISNMKLIDVDFDEPHLFDKLNKQFKYNVNLATKQIHLLDYLMSDQFKEVIKQMNNIRINKANKETIHIIQKNIINIKNNEREKLSLMKVRKKKNNIKSKSLDKTSKEKISINYKTITTVPSFKTFNSGKKTRVSSSYKNSHILMTEIYNNSVKTESYFSFNSRPTTAHNELSQKSPLHGYFSLKNVIKRNKIFLFKNNKSEKNIIKNKKLIYSASIKNLKNKKNKDKITKYSYDKYLFDKSFMKKKKILEYQYSNELLFQKQLLNSKKHDLFIPKVFNLKEIKNECDKFYFSTFEKELMNAKERNIIFGNKNFNNNNIKQKEKKNNNTFLKTQKTKEFLFTDINKNEYIFHNPNKNNFDCIDKLYGDIIYLNKKEKKLGKNFGNI